MKYHITKKTFNQHQRIASFEREIDRDICLTALRNDYGSDYEFAIEDD